MQQNEQLQSIKSRSNFRRGLAGFFIVAMAVILAGLVWFWGFLQRYELETPEAALREFTALVKDGDYNEIFARGGYTLTEHNSREKYISVLQKTLPQNAKEIKYQKKAAQNGAKQYSVFVDGEESGTIELVSSSQRRGPRLSAKAVLAGDISIKITAPSYVTVFVDGEPLLPESATEQNIPVNLLSTAPDAQKAYKSTYEINGLLFAPTITAQKPDGSGCAVLEKNGVFDVISLASEANIEEYKTLMTTAAKTYAAFTSKDASFGQLDALVMKSSPVHTAIRNFTNMWYIEHDSFAYENIEIKDIEEYSETSFSGVISFDYIVKRPGKTHVFPSKYRMVFLKENEKWKLFDLHTL